MIGTDEPIALVVMKDGIVKCICYLGNASLESHEYDRLAELAHVYDHRIYLTAVEKPYNFAMLCDEVQKAIT